MKNFKIGNKFVGKGYKPYFIGEIGINHNGSMKIAEKLIDMAFHAGIDAVKFQKRDYQSTITQKQLNMPYEKRNSFGKTYGDHKEALEFSNSELIHLSEYSLKKGIDFTCSAFDIKSYDFIEKEINPKFHKIASPQIVNHDLLERVAGYGKPILLSTGMSTFEEVRKATEIILPINGQLALLQCTSLYPTESTEVNLRVISEYAKNFDAVVGFSSHDKSVVLPAVAVALGASIFEKHITLDRTMKGPDHLSSFEERGLSLAYKYTLVAYKALGQSEKKTLNREVENRTKHRQSLVAKCDLKKGDVISEEHITYKSPCIGLMPYDKDFIIGKRLKMDLQADEAFQSDSVE